MARWTRQVTEGLGGRFQFVFTKVGHGPPTDVTFFRGVPTQLTEYSAGDPYGDAAASFTFPQITAWDDLYSADVGSWLADYANVDIYWVPAILADATAGIDYPGSPPVLDPLTNLPDILTPTQLKTGTHTDPRIKVWEGYVASMDVTADSSGSSFTVQCKGGLYQTDHYLQKPFYPPRPILYEDLIAGVFDTKRNPHLRTQPLKIAWPVGWSKVAPAFHTPDLYTPVARPGQKYTGYSTRQTGSWDRALTGFTAELLAVMLVDEHSGATPGNQWTIQHTRASAASPGRAPVLAVRDRFRTPDFSLWLGTPGVEVRVSRDTTQAANVIYGDGTGIDGTVWRNAVISNDGSRTDYRPLAAAAAIWPYVGNKLFDRSAFPSEAYYKYGTGFAADQAVQSALKSLQRDQDPGWAGDLTLKIDPSPALPRYLVRPGMTVRLMGLAGTGAAGINFHIAEVTVSPMEQTVSLKIDSRYRDLLNLEEALVRTRDPLTPAKLLQAGKRSVLIEDIQAPWDYTAGSGFVPLASKTFHAWFPSLTFPYYIESRTANSTRNHPPSLAQWSKFYVRVNANAPDRRSRWTGPVPILMSEKGSIRRAEFAAYNRYGQLLRVPFHVSIYYVQHPSLPTPNDGGGPTPFAVGALESITPTGAPNFPGLVPDPAMIIGWGNHDQPAGYSPGRLSDGGAATGLLTDDSSWSFDCTNNPDYNRNAKPGQKQLTSAITVYAWFYCEYTQPVWFMGRLYKEVQGT